MRTSFLVAIAAVLAATSAAAAQEVEMKPFVMPTLEAPGELVDLRRVFDGPRAADLPPVRTSPAGRFTAGGEPVRFWAVNVCFAACFPPHDVADKVAARLAAFGVNCVRFHHMDMRAFPRGIWAKDFSGLDAEALDRLDYFLAALKREGVYANLNLHVSRDFARTGGSMKADELPRFGKVVNIFDPELIELQKAYARDLLGRKNTYTGLKVAEDPVVAMVEITNENSSLMVLSRWAVEGLSPQYETMLTRLWNDYLADRYKTDAALREAWSPGALPRGKEMLPPLARLAAEPLAAPGDAAGGAPAWRLEQHKEAAMQAAPDGPAVHLTISKVNDTSWHLQMKCDKLALRKGQFYTLRFRARADKPRQIGAGLQQVGEPWAMLGLSQRFDLAPEWRTFEVGFTANADEADAKFSFSVGYAAGDVWLADVSLAPGGRVGLRDGESLDKRNLRRLSRDDVVTDARKADFHRFLADLDLRFFTGMRTFLRDDLGVRCPVTGTEGFTLPSDWVQSHLDFVDGHAYWEHPHFPRRPWDPRDWTIKNTAMVDDPAGSTLVGLAFQRVAGPDGLPPLRPFTVTEYNHPAPNDAQAECVPMVASFAAAQGWDGVFLFAYSHSDDWDAKAPRSFFDIHANPVKIVQMAAGALMFRRGDVPRLPATVVTEMTPEQMVALSARHGPWTTSLMNLPDHGSHPALRFFGASVIRPRAALPAAAPQPGTHVEGLAPDATPEPPKATAEPPKATAEKGPWNWTSSGDHLRWSADGRQTGVYIASGDRSAAFVGFLGHGQHVAGKVMVQQVSPAFAAITFSSLDGAPLVTSKRILITACGRVENTGQEWNADRTSVGDKWGTAPTLIEPVRATIVLSRPKPDGARLLALDGHGRPVKKLPVERGPLRGTQIALPGDPPTLWYVLQL